MSKRKVKDPVTKFVTDIVRTPISRTGVRGKENPQTYFKRNYLDTLKIITPDLYFNDDISLSGVEVPATSQLINSHMLAADATGVMSVSSLPTVGYLSSLNTVSGLSKFFVKQNNLTWIPSDDFERDILLKLGKTYSSFDSSGDFLDYLSGTFLPTIVVQRADGDPDNNLATNTASAFDNTSSGTHQYLIDKLSWLYFLNASDPATTAGVRPFSYATSSEIATLMSNNLWKGDPIGLGDTLKIFQKYLWSNYSSLSSIDERILPVNYRASGSTEYVSGTQHRDRLETLVDIVYAEDYFNDSDIKVAESFKDYISTSSLITDTESAGPFSRMEEAFGFSFADRSAEAQEIVTLVDIESCPDNFLPYLADLIGWTLIGPDAVRHRNQLRQAVAIYKAKGTKRSVQAMVDTVFGSPSAFNVTSGTLFDLWESYIPNLLFYTIATSSTLTKDGLESFTQQRATTLGLDKYFSTDLDKNVRLAVDRIMWELVNEFPNNFIFGNKIFPRVKFFFEQDPEVEYKGDWNRDEKGDYYTGQVTKSTSSRIIPTQDPNFVFKYRDRVMPIPPWEDIKYYNNCEISLGILNAIKKKLLCFGVDEQSANNVYNYINNNTLENENVDFYKNSFLFFTLYENLPFNYAEIINARRPEGNKLFSYIPYWSSKSSHFKIVLAASSFNFTSNALDKDSKYALSRIKTLVNTVAPAHSIPDIILNVSSVEDFNVNLSAITTQTVEMPLSSAAVGVSGSPSSTVLTNFAISAVNPRNASVLPGVIQTVFRREDADSLADPIFGSGVTPPTGGDIFFSSAPRNAIRRKNYKYLMNGENINLRDGVGAAGYQWLYRGIQLPKFYSTGANLQTSGEFSLGFIPSTLSFAPVALKRDPNNFGNLIDSVKLDPVWYRCQAYNSSDRFYEIDASNTFPLRGLSAVDSASTSSFFEGRGSLLPLQALQHRVAEATILHEASSIVSGYFNIDGTVNTAWPVSSVKIQPTSLSSWYEDPSKDVVNSIANQLHENASATDNVNYMRDFAFGSSFHRFYKQWLENYGRVPLNFNNRYTRADDIISHTYGPYVFNSDFEITASSVDDVAPTLVASSVGSMIDLGYNYGRGAMSLANDFGIINVAATTSGSMYVWWPEVRNDTLLSGIEFVDTSNPYLAFMAGGQNPSYVLPPTFGLLRLSNLEKNVNNNKGLPLWAQPSMLQDNLIIRYGRNSLNSLPRLRYKIEPDAGRPDIKNFLVPDCEYQLAIKACNINTQSESVGGHTLKVWIHTEPISYTYRSPEGSYVTESSVWSFFNNKWVRTKLLDIHTDTSFGTVTGRSPGLQFPLTNIQTINRTGDAESGSETSLVDNEVITPYEDLNPRIGCAEDSLDTLEEGAEQSLWGSPQIFETLTLDFDTRNSDVLEQINQPSGIQKVHNKDRKYYIEIFLEEADPESFVLFDTISMQNKTFKEKAEIPAGYYKYELGKKELKACFDYFTSLAISREASRNSIITSGSMEASGGGRLSYRDNIKREIFRKSHAPAGADGSFNQVSSLIIRGS